MLRIWFGEKKSAIYNTSLYFANQKEGKWLTEKFAKEMIKDVDNSEVVGENLIQSPIFGPIPPEKLSSGVKTLILIKNEPRKIFNASNCGDNCAKWLLKIGDMMDVTVNLHHIMNFGKNKFKVKVMNNNKIVDNMEDFIIVAHKYLVKRG